MKAILTLRIIAAASLAASAAGADTITWPAASAIAPANLETLTPGPGPVSLALRFKLPSAGWTGALLTRRATPGEPSICVTAFMHEPFGKRYLGVALDGVADGPNQAAALTVRDSVIGGHLVCAFTELETALDAGEHELVFRTDGKTAGLFIDGVLRESRSAERFTARTFLKLLPHEAVGWKRGSAVIGDIRFWSHALTDAEVKAASHDAFTTPKLSTGSPKGFAAYLYPAGWTDEQRMAAVDEAMPRWLADKLAKDKWFPRFHVAVPAGMMFDTRCAIHGGRYHLFPTWRPDMNLTHGQPGAFRMMHFSSSDLLHWRIDPVPMRFPDRDVCNGSPATIDGKPQFFFLRYSRDGAPHRAVPTGVSLLAWTLPEAQPAITTEGEGYNGRLDSVVFQHGGKTYLTGTRRNTKKTSMAMPLYRSDDLVSWNYIGDFFQTQTKPFNECPQIFHVGGKMVVAAFYALHGRQDNYLVGRFENEKFIMEGSGVWDHGGHGHVRSFDAEPAPDGRVIGWSTISVYADHDALDVARMGWKGMHSLPKEVTLRPDNTLALHPAEENEQLRLGAAISNLPSDHHGQFEVQTTLAGKNALTFTTPDGSCSLSYDDQTQVLTFDQSNSPKVGADHGHIFQSAPLADGRVRVFFDHSVFEVFADGQVLTSRYFSTEPGKMAVTSSVPRLAMTAWRLGTVWAAP